MNIFRYYNQNKKSIWIAIIAIIILIIAIQTINNIVKNRQENKENIIKINESEYRNNLNINVLLTEEDVKEDVTLIIDQFIRYCNAGKIEEAYALLSEDCKQEMFPTLQYFKQNYVDIYFFETKLYSKEKYRNQTYKIKLYNDIISTGKVEDTIEDYYTIQKENNIIKLNISNYIGKKTLNKNNRDNDLRIVVLNKRIYKDYEKYEIEIENLTYKTILLDTKSSTKTMYLVGKNNVQYYSLSHEVLTENLVVKPKATIKVFIKYTKEYNSNQTVYKLCFSDIVTDYDLYKINKNNVNKKVMEVSL